MKESTRVVVMMMKMNNYDDDEIDDDDQVMKCSELNLNFHDDYDD